MSDQNALDAVVRDEFAVYLKHLAGRVDQFVGRLPDDKLWVRPFPFGNSVGNLVLHLTGNLSHYVGARIGRTGYVRDRPREFADPGGYPAEEILAGFHAAVDQVLEIIRSRSAADLASPIADEQPIRTEFGLFLVVTAHLNNHLGQMSYLVQALEGDPELLPSW